MIEVVWRNRATRHLQQIYQYILVRNPSAAEKYASELQAACQALEQFPERAPRYNRRYRTLVFRNHLVFYRYDRQNARVYIAAIIDARQDVDRIARGLDG